MISVLVYLHGVPHGKEIVTESGMRLGQFLPPDIVSGLKAGIYQAHVHRHSLGKIREEPTVISLDDHWVLDRNCALHITWGPLAFKIFESLKEPPVPK